MVVNIGKEVEKWLVQSVASMDTLVRTLVQTVQDLGRLAVLWRPGSGAARVKAQVASAASVVRQIPNIHRYRLCGCSSSGTVCLRGVVLSDQ